MREFMNHIVHSFKEATSWYRDNSYSDLNDTANELLNFPTPGGLRLTLSSLATPHFATSYTLGSVGLVDGSVSYLYSSVPLAHVVAKSESIPLPTLLRSWRQLREFPRPTLAAVHDALLPAVPPATGGKSLTSKMYESSSELYNKPTLLYGRLYLPRSVLEAMLIKRMSPSLQLQLMAVSDAQMRNGGTMLGVLQYDKGKYGLEGLGSTDGGLLGIRGLYNFGGDTAPPPAVGAAAKNGNETVNGSGPTTERERIYGRFSAGGELYYGTLNKSGGMSLGLRFATLPSHAGTPMNATVTVNPLMGSLSANYCVLAGRSLALASKFDFNVYSYESDWAVGVEFWNKRKLVGPVDSDTGDLTQRPSSLPRRPRERSFQAKMEWRLDDSEPLLTSQTATKPQNGGGAPAPNGSVNARCGSEDKYHGMLKARLDQHMRIGLLWEGRMQALLFSVGTAIDLNKLDQPFRNVGLEVQFSS